jgi:putative endonuclease
MWYVYILLCSDNSFYTGVTTDLSRRLRQHNGELVWWAKYTRTRQPLEIIFKKEFNSRSEACKEESRIKKLSRSKKEILIKWN